MVGFGQPMRKRRLHCFTAALFNSDEEVVSWGVDEVRLIERSIPDYDIEK